MGTNRLEGLTVRRPFSFLVESGRFLTGVMKRLLGKGVAVGGWLFFVGGLREGRRGVQDTSRSERHEYRTEETRHLGGRLEQVRHFSLVCLGPGWRNSTMRV